MERAQASIEKGVVQLGNAWLQRRWSSFLGTTTELRRKPDDTDCLTRRSPEFHLDYGERPLAAPDLGDIRWSEDGDAHGVSVVLNLEGPGVAVRVETYAFHRYPGMVRMLSVTNTGGEPVSVTRAAAEVLPLQPERFRVTSVQGESEFKHLLGGTPVYYAALRAASEVILLGALQKARFALFNPNPAYCAPVWDGCATLAPGRQWHAPAVSMLWLRDEAARDPAREIASFHRLWEARNAARDAFYPSRN